MRYSTDTIPEIGTIQTELYRQRALYSTGTIPAVYTIQPALYRPYRHYIRQALYRKQALLDRHYVPTTPKNRHYLTGTVPAIDAIRQTLYRKQAPFDRHYTHSTRKQALYRQIGTIQPALYRKQALFDRHYTDNIRKQGTILPALHRH